MFGLGHRLLPAAAGPLPRRAHRRPARRDDHRAAPAPGRRSSPRAGSSSWSCSCSASPTTTRPAGWARCSRSAPRSPCSPGSRCCPRCWSASACAQSRRESALWPRIGAFVKARPAALAAAVLALSDRGRARQPARQRHARLRGAVPLPARIGRRAAGHAGEVPAWPERPARRGDRCRRRRRRAAVARRRLLRRVARRTPDPDPHLARGRPVRRRHRRLDPGAQAGCARRPSTAGPRSSAARAPRSTTPSRHSRATRS